VTIGGERGLVVTGSRFPIQKEPERLDYRLHMPFETHTGREGGKKRNPVTVYNDCVSLFTQAKKDFTEETATNKTHADPIALLSVASDVEDTRYEALRKSVCPSSRLSSLHDPLARDEKMKKRANRRVYIPIISVTQLRPRCFLD
jgi:hypothetical protein